MANKKSATVVWQHNDLDFGLTLGSGFQFNLSGSAGPETGASPLELLAGGLAGCTAMDVISILQKKRQQVTDFEVHVYTQRAEEYPKVFNAIKVEYVVYGQNIDEAAVQRAIELSETKYCPVIATFKNANVPLELTYKIEEVAPTA